MTSKKPDFKKANIKANELLVVAKGIGEFPFKVTSVIKDDEHFQIKSFDYAKKVGIDIEAFGSESAVLQKKGDRYIIFYNQDEKMERIKFSLLHEYAHYVLGDKMENLSKEEYDRDEVEANYFAAQVLMPEQIINELRDRGEFITKDYLVEHFGVSSTAANKRIETLGKLDYSWRSEEEKFYDETLMFKFAGFMDSIRRKSSGNRWYSDEYERQRERDSWEFDRRVRY